MPIVYRKGRTSHPEVRIETYVINSDYVVSRKGDGPWRICHQDIRRDFTHSTPRAQQSEVYVSECGTRSWVAKVFRDFAGSYTTDEVKPEPRMAKWLRLRRMRKHQNS